MKSQKIFKKFKKVGNGEGTKNVRIPHILRTIINFLVFLDFDLFENYLGFHRAWLLFKYVRYT